MLLTDGLPRLNDDDYVISPLSSASTTGNGFSAGADRNLEGYAAGTVGRGPPGPMSTLQRNRNAFPFPRSSSFSEPSYNTGLHFPGRFSRPGEPLAHPGLPYGRRPMDYMSRPGMVVGYEQPRQMEGSVSPTGAPEQAMSYMDGHSTLIFSIH